MTALNFNFSLLLLSTSALFAVPARSEPLVAAGTTSHTESIQPSEFAGDLLGLRPRLADDGIALSGHYISETAWNLRGGSRRDITAAGEFGVGLQFDMQKIAGTDGTFQATVTYRHGRQLDSKAGLGTLQEVQEIYGRGQTWRLTQFWYEQRLLGGAIAVKAGRTAPSEDFASFSCIFQNLAFCGSQPGNIVAGYWYNWPVSQWGVRVRASNKRAYAQIAVYEENPRNLDKKFTVGHFKGATGVLVPVEIGFSRGTPEGGRIGSYKIGGWISTTNNPDVLADTSGEPFVLTAQPPAQRSAGRGVWISAEQQVTGRSKGGESVSGLSLFLNALTADRRTTIIDNQLVVGLLLRDPLLGVSNDMLGVAVARTHVNNRFEKTEILAGRPGRGAEYSGEIFYGFSPVPWLDVRPNLQWIHNPGGRRDARDIVVVGIKSHTRI